MTPNAGSRGPETLRVRVTGAPAAGDGGLVDAEDQLGKPRRVRYDTRAKGTGRPAPGELWTAVRSGGETWFLDRLLGHPDPPVVTGSRALADPVTLSLLAALARLGVVSDGTAP